MIRHWLGGDMSALLDALFIIAIIFLLSVFLSLWFGGIPNAIGAFARLVGLGAGPGSAGNVSAIVIRPTTINQSRLAEYALQLINNDRAKYGLAPVTLSNEPSAQQHADNMLANNYFSHWDLYGMKPYMRYTLLGGNGSVTENVAYEYASECGVMGCTGTINANQSLQKMEYNMMYNDSACCNNGHRDNILNPYHNQVSIGVAYNSSTIYFVEDFINNYISWSGNTPAYGSNGEVYLEGSIQPGYSLSQVSVSYDPPVQNLTRQTVPAGPYSYGTEVAGVVGSPLYYYQNISTIVADTYSNSGNDFAVDFNIRNLIKRYGAGEYTVMLLLNDSRAGPGFTGSTYTIFINRRDAQYMPGNV